MRKHIAGNLYEYLPPESPEGEVIDTQVPTIYHVITTAWMRPNTSTKVLGPNYGIRILVYPRDYGVEAAVMYDDGEGIGYLTQLGGEKLAALLVGAARVRKTTPAPWIKTTFTRRRGFDFNVWYDTRKFQHICCPVKVPFELLSGVGPNGTELRHVEENVTILSQHWLMPKNAGKPAEYLSSGFGAEGSWEHHVVYKGSGEGWLL